MSETGGGRMDAFTHLGSEVRDALSERGFTTPTEPQRRAVPALADGRNGLVVAPTGTGKTETAMLPVFDALVSDGGPPDGFGALYVTPLRALNRDMRERLDWWGETLGLEVDVRHGDTTDYQRRQQATDPPDVLVTTPETLQAMLTGSTLRDGLADVEHVVVDEVHELAGAKRGAQLAIGLERLVEVAGRVQRIGLSATVGDPHEIGAFLTGGRGCEIIEVDVTSNVSFEVREPAVTDADERLASELLTTPAMASHVRAIREIVDRHDSVLIFVNTRQTAEALGSRFKELDANIGVHHGSLSKDARIDVEDRFKSGDLDGLLCTSSMELGIDVGGIDHVVQYNSPREVKRLLQRVGRAGHSRDAVSEGTVITGSTDDTLEALAVADRANEGAVEDTQVHHGSLDTVANQIVGVVMDVGETEAWHAYNIITRAYPFKELTEETFRAVAMELHRNRVVYVDEDDDTISTSGGTWQYYYANLSMIPDEETYEVYDMAGGRQVGTLDERFVVNFAEPGATFVQRGEMWRITNIDEDDQQVEVSPIEDPAGEVPSWTGQEIPVPYAVAQAVGGMRATGGRQLGTGTPKDAVARDVAARYPTTHRTAGSALDRMARHVTEQDAPVPSAERIVVEQAGSTVVVNACFGHEVNETLGRLVSALLGQQTGSSVGLDAGPYRIELEVPSRVSATDVVAVLRDTDPDHVAGLLELSLKQSETLKFTLAQVAAKFGALKRWKGRDGVGLSRLLGALEDTPVYEEAIREVFHTTLDVARASDVLARVQSGELGVEIVGKRTAVGAGGRSAGTELLTPEHADASVVQTIKDRIQDDRVKLFCVHCADWSHETMVRRVTDQPECPRCGSTRIAALSPWADEVITAVRADDKDDEQDDRTQRAYRNASIVQSHGKRAVIALSARGVGPRNAARVINRHRETEAEFYRDILEREREYARTKAFW
ncbi:MULTISPECIES: DEAD/DEAH box helicase [Halobacterium]|uniref:DEAD/DEAH box helicase n=1 Tax=Halobacterium TaxID=2239 RepID=UPI0019662AEF|nr:MULTISPECIES: DEAD/DEAH box helicase [Halobacterium]MDL0122086.1 DEAD/DEAH box helicase [Halobacterium salinarum]QRY25742.1 DEAD/DEAH box helicase [Halobacterium sp. BOL4-2]